MESFEVFIKDGSVQVRRKDPKLATNLIKSGVDRIRYAESHKLTKEDAQYILENSYESLRELADAELAVQGYKSFSHEAAISFLQRFPEFKRPDLEIFDKLRKKKIGIKYYGESASIEEAKFSLEFAKEFIIKLKLLLDKQLGGKDGK